MNLDSRFKTRPHDRAFFFVSFRDNAPGSLFDEYRKFPSYESPPTIEKQFNEHCQVLGFNDKDTTHTQIWLENMQRLGLLVLENDAEVNYVPEDEDRSQPSVSLDGHRSLSFTAFGRAFLKACAPSEPEDGL